MFLIKKTIILNILILLFIGIFPFAINAKDINYDNFTQDFNPGNVSSISNVKSDEATINVSNFSNGTGDSKATEVRLTLDSNNNPPIIYQQPITTEDDTFSIVSFGLYANTIYEVAVEYYNASGTSISEIENEINFITLLTNDPYASNVSISNISKTSFKLNLKVENIDAIPEPEKNNVADNVYMKIFAEETIFMDWTLIDMAWGVNEIKGPVISGVRPNSNYSVQIKVGSENEFLIDSGRFLTKNLVGSDVILDLKSNELQKVPGQNNLWEVNTSTIGIGEIDSIEYKEISNPSWINIPTSDFEIEGNNIKIKINNTSDLKESELIFRVNQNDELVSLFDDYIRFVPESNPINKRKTLIIGSVVGGIGFALILGLVILFIYKKKKFV